MYALVIKVAGGIVLLKLATDRREASRGFSATAEHLVYASVRYAQMRYCFYVPMTPSPMPTSAFLSFRKNTERISVKFVEVATSNGRTDYILGEIEPERQGAG